MKTRLPYLMCISLIAMATLSGCKVSKDVAREKTDLAIRKDVETTATKVTTEKQQGGNIDYNIIPEAERPRDDLGELVAFVRTYKDGGLTKTVHYKPDGSVSVNCNVEDILRTIREEFRSMDNSTVEQTGKIRLTDFDMGVDPKFILYGVIALFLLGALIVVLIFRSLKKNAGLINEILKNT